MPRSFLFLLLLAGSLSATAQKGLVIADTQIRTVLDQQSNAWNRGDIEGYMKAGYWPSDSLFFMGKSGATYGFDSTLARYKRSYSDKEQMGQLTFTIYKVEVLSAPDKSGTGGSAWVAGGWQIKRPAGNLAGAFLLVWKRFPEGWRIVADHSS